MSGNGGEVVAVFGGSFDPPHSAHVLVAAWVLSTAEVDRLLVVPTHRHPLGKEHATPFEARVRMCELAMEPLRRVEVSTIEAELRGEGFTLDLLEALRERMPRARLRLVVGSDILGQTGRWHRWDRIEELAPPIVVGRQGFVQEEEVLALPAISSTEVRAKLRAGAQLTGWVPTSVLDYVEAHGLYGRGRA